MSKMLSENSRHLIAQAYQSGVCKAKTLAAIFQTATGQQLFMNYRLPSEPQS